MPPIIISLMTPFRGFFTAPVWEHVLALITGMVLAPGKRHGERRRARQAPLARPTTSRSTRTAHPTQDVLRLVVERFLRRPS
jgi:hypothetical protein